MPGFRVAEGSQRHQLPGRGADVEQPERRRVHPVLRLSSMMTWYWLVGRIDGGNLAGAIGVVERILDLLGVTPSEAALSRSISTFTCGFLSCRSLVTSWSMGNVRSFASKAAAFGRVFRVRALQNELVLALGERRLKPDRRRVLHEAWMPGMPTVWA